MSTVVLVRPGCTDFDEQKRIQGSLDLPLNHRGQCQLEKVIDAIRDQPVEAVVTGPCDPCRSTAEAVAHALDVTIKEKKALCNLDQGLWQGLCVDEIRKKFPRAFRQWEESPQTVCPPEGETVASVVERMISALKKPLKKYDCFVVVASEPLASLVSCTLRGAAPEDIGDSMFGCCDDHLVEIIQTSESANERTGSSEQIPIAAATCDE
ncbi:MAG: histidine phosphatase family protein [Rhodopirellula sp.]|nr:histidine phosphatase family protein [Rhodopirellula sp.]